MSIEAFIMAWNEADTIRLTIEHYQKFCGRITILDNYSDDGTEEIAKSLGCEIKKFGIKGLLSDVEYTKVKNHCWKQSKADWVIVCDADEILQDITTDASISGTIVKTFGWQVFSDRMPEHSWSELSKGFADANYSKSIMFKPSRIKEINYVHGCHVAKPDGDVFYSHEIKPLFHYRNVGGYERLIKRHDLYRQRMSDWNKRWGCGIHYTYDDERRKKEWLEQYEKSVQFSADFISGSGKEIQK